MNPFASARCESAKPRRTTACAVLLAGAAALAGAQTPPTQTGPAVPSAPHERLAFFEGSWRAAGVPAADNFVETCGWLPEGRRHMVCRTRWAAASGPREGWSIFSYTVGDARYTYHGFRAGGSVVVLQGHEQGGVWRFDGEQGRGDALTRTRATITAQPDGGFVFVQETAIAAGPWSAGAPVRYERIAR